LTPGQVANHFALRTATVSVSLPLSASDADSDALLFSATGLPPGLAINPLTGVISGDPLVVGDYAVTATVTDPEGLSASQTFDWTVTSTLLANPHRPAVTNPGNQSTSLPQSYGYAATVLAANPAGYWRMEDYTGTSVADSAATPHPGTA